jgi:hypothetical protein
MTFAPQALPELCLRCHREKPHLITAVFSKGEDGAWRSVFMFTEHVQFHSGQPTPIYSTLERDPIQYVHQGPPEIRAAAAGGSVCLCEAFSLTLNIHPGVQGRLAEQLAVATDYRLDLIGFDAHGADALHYLHFPLITARQLKSGE